MDNFSIQPTAYKSVAVDLTAANSSNAPKQELDQVQPTETQQVAPVAKDPNLGNNVDILA